MPRILVVEDDSFVRMVAVDALEMLGFEVEEAATAAEALAKIHSVAIDGAMIDLGLPDRPGDQLAQELRALHAELPIIVATGYGESTVRQRLAADAHLRFLGKPYDVDHLEAVLRSLDFEPSAA